VDVLREIEAFGTANRLKAAQFREKAAELRRSIGDLPGYYLDAQLLRDETRAVRAKIDAAEKDANRYARQAEYNAQGLILMDSSTVQDLDILDTPMAKAALKLGLVNFTDESAPDPTTPESDGALCG
jgi:hypothetical protein